MCRFPPHPSRCFVDARHGFVPADRRFAVLRDIGVRRGGLRRGTAGTVRVRVRCQRSDDRRPKGPARDAQRRRRDRLLPYPRPGRLSAHRPVQVRRRQRFHRPGGPRTGHRRRRRARAKGRRPGALRPGSRGRPGALRRSLGPGSRRRPVRRQPGALLLLAADVVRVRLPAVLAVRAVPLRQPVPVHWLLPV